MGIDQMPRQQKSLPRMWTEGLFGAERESATLEMPRVAFFQAFSSFTLFILGMQGGGSRLGSRMRVRPQADWAGTPPPPQECE